MAPFSPPIDAQRSGPVDRLWAAALATAMHLLLLAWIIDRAGQGNVGQGTGREGFGAGMSVTFVALPPSPQPAAEVPTPTSDPASRARDGASEAARPTSEKGDRVESPILVSRPDVPDQRDIRSGPFSAGGSTGDDLQASYHAALRAAIQRKWRELGTQRFPSGCRLQLALGPGGVVNATTAGGCDLPANIRQQLEAAALMAQPLPYAGYEPVFAPEVWLEL